MKCFLFAGLLLGTTLRAASSESALDANINRHIAEIVALAASPEIIDAVVAQNRKLPSSFGAMTQQKWAALDKIDPFVFSFKSNAAGMALRRLPRPLISEAFINDAAGYKVAFLEKPTFWNHKGKPKHEQPLAGGVWRGPVEIDDSSSTTQVQVAVPILSKGKPVGSLVVGLSIFQLAEKLAQKK